MRNLKRSIYWMYLISIFTTSFSSHSALAQGSPNSSASLEVEGFTQLGADAPSIKMKKLSGTSSSLATGAVQIAHGVSDVSKILSVDIFLEAGPTLLPPGVWQNGSDPDNILLYSYLIEGDFIIIVNNSYQLFGIPPPPNPITSLPIRILITYEE